MQSNPKVRAKVKKKKKTKKMNEYNLEKNI